MTTPNDAGQNAAPMELFSAPWLHAWQRELNDNAAYRDAAAQWEWPLILSITSEGQQGGAAGSERSAYLDLWHGQCRAARPAERADEESARFIISGSIAVWRQVLDGRLEVVSAIMLRRLSLDKGSVASLLGYIGAAKALVVTAAALDTDYPEGV
ncbi:MAG TPA: SCP2 sterol-binding domain-containing protein [Candidatus Eremiobacteraceae bacterium]